MTRIVADTSAFIAILLGEPDAERYEEALFAHRGEIVVGAATAVETLIVAESRRPSAGGTDFRTILDVYGISTAPFDADLTAIAFQAWRRFGKGRHPAALNFGDCLAYAQARHLEAPLLFKGEDFLQTDVRSVLL